jgi:hypothetical protein
MISFFHYNIREAGARPAVADAPGGGYNSGDIPIPAEVRP